MKSNLLLRTRLLLLLIVLSSLTIFSQTKTENSFRFSVFADTRVFAGPERDTDEYFKGVLLALKDVGPGEFVISPGDIDPPSNIRWTIDKYLGEDFIWYPVVGNHETDSSAYMEYLREYNKNGTTLPYIVNAGPPGSEETTYSFDYNNAHFIVLNQYYDGECDICLSGDITDPLYNWLNDDLSKTDKEHIFVFGHEPAFPQPDEYNYRFRHERNSLNKYRENRDRFWNLLEENKVKAYFCGHTHTYSAVLINTVWQIDAGHARGKGDTGSPSTFLTLDIDSSSVNVTVYRDKHDGVYDYKDIVKKYTIAK